MTELVEQMALNFDQFSNTLKDNARAAEDVAQAILRYDDAIQDAEDHLEEWKAALESGSLQDQAEIFNDLRDAYGDFLNIDGSLLSTNFLQNAENLTLMQEAMQGNVEAYNALKEAAAQSAAVELGFDISTLYDQRDQIYGILQSISGYTDLSAIPVGFEFDDEQLMSSLNEIINQVQMTAEQAEGYLAQAFGLDTEVIQESEPSTQTVTVSGTHAILTPVQKEGYPQNYMAYDVTNQPYTDTVEVPSVKKGTALKVITAKKEVGGDVKFKHSQGGAGSKGVARRAAKAEKAAKQQQKAAKQAESKLDKSQKDYKDPNKEQFDIYHDINLEIKDIDRNLSRVQKRQDRLYGKQLLDNLNQQTAILQQHKAKLREKQSLQQADLAQQQQMLATLGVVFDQYGNIANYMGVLAQKQAIINGLIQEYNNLITQFNAETDKELKENLNKQIQDVNKRISAAQDDLKTTKDKINAYDSLKQAMEDITDQIEEDTQKQIEINIKKFRMEVEIRLEMGQAQRDWNNFRRNVMEHTDIIKDTDFSRIFKDAKKDVDDIFSYFNVNGSKGSIQKLTEQLWDTKAQIDSINATGTSSIYGDNKAQAMQDLQGDLDTLMGQMEDIKNLIDEIDQAYLDTIDDIESQMDKQIQDYEFVNELINHDIMAMKTLPLWIGTMVPWNKIN